jgi:hypothetical protein
LHLSNSGDHQHQTYPKLDIFHQSYPVIYWQFQIDLPFLR